MSERLADVRERLERFRGETGAIVALALVTYIPLLLTHRGDVGADTKNYLYLDPARLMSRAWTMWDHNVGLGTVTHQNIGYLWPMGPYYWTMDALGFDDWTAQRLWLGSIMFLAGLGVRWMMRTLHQRGLVVGAAMFIYALTPYVLSLSARLSALLLPFVALPWMIGLAVRSGRERSWRYPALFALLVTTTGSSNATALFLAGVAPVLWFVFAVWVEREITLGDALRAIGRIGVLTLVASLWWMGGLYAQGSFGIDVLEYSETAKTVANPSTAPELLRGLGYWFFYGDDKLGPWIEPSVPYTQNLALIGLTFLIPSLGLLAAGLLRWKHRAYFVSLVLAGLTLAVGAHPWNDPPLFGSGVKAFLLSDVGLAMRSLPRAAPLIVLGLSVLLAVAISALAQWLPRVRKPAAIGAMVLAVLALPPLWTGNMVANNLQRPEKLPPYMYEAAEAWDQGSDQTRIFEVPGIDFASYRWGNTVDPVMPGIMDRPYIARELIPYGTPPGANLLNEFDRSMHEGTLDPASVAPIARLLRAGEVALRADLAYERYNIARPRQTYRLLQEADGLESPTAYGPPTPNVADPAFPLMDETELDSPPSLEDPPKIASFPVSDPEPILGLQSGKQPILVAGDAAGLVDMAGSGLITGHELLMFAASFADDPDQMRELLGDEGELVLTDTNRKAGRRWGTVHETNGYTEEADEEALAFDSTDNRLPVFPDADTDSFTVAEHRGVHARATTYGNPVSFIPESRPAMAVDDDPTTAWLVGAFASIKGEAIELRWDKPRTTDSIRLAQPTGGFQNRFITKISLRLDDGPEQVIELSDLSEIEAGQIIRFPKQSFSKARITLLESDDGQDVTFTGLSAVGFADIRLGDDDVTLDELIRLPTDMLDAVGEQSLDHPLSVLLTRQRIRPTVALRDDPESSIVRTFELPTDRTFALEGQIRFSDDAPENILDRLLGIPTSAEGGVDSFSSRQLPGAITARASSAIDGDPKTHWSPGFLRQRGEVLNYKTAQPVSFDQMDLTVVNDLRHSIPTQIRIWARGQEPVVVDVPPIEDQLGRNKTSTVHLEFPRVTGDDITFSIAQARSVTTNDWYSKLAVATPVGISELGVPGLSVPTPAGRVDDRCRSDLVRVNGTSIPIRLQGTVADALAGRPLHFEACDEAGVAIPAGKVEVRSARGEDVGLDVDRLVLRSAAGGGVEPEPSAPLTADGGQGGDEGGSDGDPSLRITGKTRVSFDADVNRTDDDTWLVLGQSQSLGWHLSVDGEDLGPPVLVNGYANGWKLPKRDGPLEIKLQWTPQRVVNGGLIASVFGLLLCLVLALLPRRRLTMADHADLDPPPSPLTPRLSAGYLGRRPGVATTVVAAVATLLVFSALVSVPAGALLALGMVIALRWRPSRLLIALLPGVMLGLSGIYTILVQVRRGTRAGYEWPISLEEIHQVGWGAVGLLVIGVVADRLWSGRWWGDPAEPGDTTATVAPPVAHDPDPEPEVDRAADGAAVAGEVTADGDEAPLEPAVNVEQAAPRRDDDDDVASPVP